MNFIYKLFFIERRGDVPIRANICYKLPEKIPEPLPKILDTPPLTRRQQRNVRLKQFFEYFYNKQRESILQKRLKELKKLKKKLKKKFSSPDNRKISSMTYVSSILEPEKVHVKRSPKVAVDINDLLDSEVITLLNSPDHKFGLKRKFFDDNFEGCDIYDIYSPGISLQEYERRLNKSGLINSINGTVKWNYVIAKRKGKRRYMKELAVSKQKY
mmetsp:Transcript_22563/g.20487  ORF Transcript_22563/g.20487 Transcript_22563/m.20487 type:complete len:214 (-) Transcript_22563:36-677(-)